MGSQTIWPLVSDFSWNPSDEFQNISTWCPHLLGCPCSLSTCRGQSQPGSPSPLKVKSTKLLPQALSEWSLFWQSYLIELKGKRLSACHPAKAPQSFSISKADLLLFFFLSSSAISSLPWVLSRLSTTTWALAHSPSDTNCSPSATCISSREDGLG